MRGIDFSSWQSLFATLLGLALVTLIGMGIRLMMMFAIQQRRERMNRQINERLRTLIAAYKVLGGSFTGDLSVDPRHMRDIRRGGGAGDDDAAAHERSDRARRIRDAVESALSDIILLGTEDQVRLAEQAARDLVAGRPVRTHALVVSLRDFIRKALDLTPVPRGLDIPPQGPTRPSGSKSGRDDAKGGGSGGGGGCMGMGMGMGGSDDVSQHKTG
ncbi:hypothetical protein [Brevundimonas sp.]|uniref:hypothetical protein n=1 Tax=Brevundimonas sp. TaxID=1871086 RepID=UPI00289EAF85|nr:hypothetical protein [Brevundimonas sp.]